MQIDLSAGQPLQEIEDQVPVAAGSSASGVRAFRASLLGFGLSGCSHGALLL